MRSLEQQRFEHLLYLWLITVGDIETHRIAVCRVIAEQRARRQHHAFFQCRLGQQFTVDARRQARPDKHPTFIAHRQFAAATLEPLLDPSTGLHQALHHPLAVLGVAAFAEHAVHDLFEQLRGHAAAHQLHIGQVGRQLRSGDHETDAGVRAENLGEARQVGDLVQAGEGGEARRWVGVQVAVEVILDDMASVLLGQLQQAKRLAWAEGMAGGVLQHAGGEVQAGAMFRQ